MACNGEDKVEEDVGDESGSDSETEARAPADATSTADTEDTDLAAAIAAIRGNKDLPRPAYPTLPNLGSSASMTAKVFAVQGYIEKLSYNFTGVNYFDTRKQRPMSRIMETAREITRQA